MNSQVVSKMPSRSRKSVSVLSFFALPFNSAKMIIFLVSIIFLGGLFASPAEAAVYEQGTFTANTTSVNVGFKPRAVIFYWSNQTAAGFVSGDSAIGMGFAANNTASGIEQAVLAIGARDGNETTNNASSNRTDSAILIKTNGNDSTFSGEAVVTGFTATGFTLNWSQAAGSTTVIHYIALDETEFTDAKVGNSSWASGVSGNQDVTSVNFQPDFVMTLGSQRDQSLTADSGSAAINIGMMSDSSGVQQATLGYGGRDGYDLAKGTYSTGHILNNTDISFMYRNAVDSAGTFISMLGNGFRINVTNSAAGTQNFHYLALEGGLHDIGLMTKPTSVTSQAVTGVGFQPTGLMFLSNNDTQASRSNSSPQTSKVSIGAASPTNESSIWFQDKYVVEDTPSDVYMGMQTNKAILMRETTGTDGLADLTSMNADGFTLNWTTSDTSARRVVYWAVGSSGPPPPTLTVNEPNGAGDTVTQGDTYSINYDLADSDSVVTAAFYYDTNNSGLDGTAITGACATAAEGAGATCTWNTSGVTPGTYYVYGVADDGTNPAVSDYSSGQITINAPVCSESITSSIIWNGTTSAAGDFNGSSFITANDVNTLQYQVTEGGGLGTVTQATAWANAYNGSGVTPLTVSNPFDVANGPADRILFVYLGTEGSNPSSISVSYGGMPMTLAGSELGSNNDSFVYYLNAADLAARSGNDLDITGNPSTQLKIAYTVLDGVDQASPGTFVSNSYATTGNGPWTNPALNVGAGDLVITGITQQRSSSDLAFSVTPAEFTVDFTNYSTANSLGVATRNNTNANGSLAVSWNQVATGGSNKSVWAMVVKAAAGEATVISWTADSIPAIANLTDTNSYNLYVRGTEAECSVDTYFGDPSVGNTTADGTAQSFTWSAAPPNIAATLVVNQPDGVGDIIAEGGTFTVNYDLSDSDDATTVSFFYETDGNGAGGTAIGSCGTQPEATGGTCAWDTTGVTPGSYYVYGTTNGDGAGAATVVSSGTMRINDTVTLVVNQPDGAGDTIAEGGNFTINYDLSDSNNVATVAFFYDTNNSGIDGTAIGSCAAEPEANGGTCVWNTSGVAPGSYFVYGTTSGDWAGASTVYSSGPVTINEAPALSISEPNGTGDTVTLGDAYNITYTLTDSDDTITAAFFYDSDAAGFNGTAISGDCAAAAEGSGATCAWDTTSMTPGDYYVYGTSTTDAYNSAAQAYSPGVITISSNSVASLVVNQPDGTNDTIAEGTASFTVNYDLSDSDDVTTVAFFYDTNNSGADGTAIAGCGTEPEATGGTCVWNTSSLTPGDYYVYGTTSGDGAGVNTIYSSGAMTINDAPALSISEPNGVTVTEGDVYNITYTLTDGNDTITAAFFYDTDTDMVGGTAITGACTTAAMGTDVTCAWDTSGVLAGSYYVYGTSANDALNITAQAISPGLITINSPATLAVNQPDGTNDTIAEGGDFTINYDLSDIDDVTTVSFYYDTDNNPGGGSVISGCGTQPEGTGRTCTWNTIGVPSGSYYVYGTTSGEWAGATTVYSSGTMTINDAPALSISEPNGTNDTVAPGAVYNITYTLTDSDDTVTAAFYYDSDSAGFNGTAISGACATAAEGSGVTCAWDTSGMTFGTYYVYGISTTDGFNSAAQAYSPGVITFAANSAATLVVNQPDGVGDTINQGDSFTINYDLSDSDDVTTVAFFYDTNNSDADGTAIGGCAAEPEATSGTCTWNTSGVAPGSYYVYGTTSGDGAGAATVYSTGVMTIITAQFSYAPGDDGTNPGGGDSIAGISRSGGDDSNNLQSFMPKINVEYEFRINLIDDSGESPLVEPMLYIAHRDTPTEGAGGDFFVYPLVCTGVTWGTGKTCTTTMKLGPAASHKFYFYAEKTNGTVLRKPSSGYTDGPEIHLIGGYSLAGVSRDIDSSNHDGSAAFNSPYSYGWVSAGVDTDFDATFNGDYVSVTSFDNAEAGRGYFVYKQSNMLPQLGSNSDVTAASHTITLLPGWNMISNPYNGNVKLDDIQIRQNAGTTSTWSDAAANNWIESAVYYYQGIDWGDTHTFELAELVPWMGYWMYVKDLNSYELIITKPAQ